MDDDTVVMIIFGLMIVGPIIYQVFFSKSRTERMVLKLERIMMNVEAATLKNDREFAIYNAVKIEKVMHWLNVEGDWDSGRVMGFIESRGLVRYVHDEGLRDRISEFVSGY